MAGKSQKPASQLQNRREGRVERRTFPVLVPRAPLRAPRAPRALGAAGRAIWRDYWTDPVCLAATGVDRYSIAKYCQLHDRLEAIEAQILEEGDVIRGANGPIQNPRVRVWRLVWAMIERIGEQLGVRPLPRMRLGLVQTQRDLGVADLRARLDRGGRAPHPDDDDAIEAEATVVVDLDALG